MEISLKEILQVSHIKNESIVKIVLIDTSIYFCYILISKYGRVGLYDGNLNFLLSYHLIMTREDIDRKEEERRRRNRWVTDALFSSEILMFLVANSTRGITIYEASNLIHVPLWLISCIPNIVECLTYHPDPYDSNKSYLFMGDDSGKVSALYFQQPKISLLRKKHTNKLNIFYWQELLKEKAYVHYKYFGQMHRDNVRKIEFFPDNKTITTCSKDSYASVSIKSLKLKLNCFTFKIDKGCSCFALSRSLRILITGSENGYIRIWNTVTPQFAISTIHAHSDEVIDIRIFEKQKIFISCDRKAVLKLWDIDSEKLLQTLQINFPSFDILGKKIEWGIESIYPGPRCLENLDETNHWQRSLLLICCCNHIGIIKVTFEEGNIENSTILSPPPLQNSVLIPKTWKTQLNNPLDDSEVLDEVIIENFAQKHIDEVMEVLNNRITDSILPKDNINYKIACLERKKNQMQKFVVECAPYLALDLAEVEELRLSENLSMPKKKRDRKLVEKLQKIIEEASLKDAVFSESISSRSSRSSRSSTIDYSN